MNRILDRIWPYFQRRKKAGIAALADNITGAAHILADNIETRLAAALSGKTRRRPFFLLLGEDHGYSAHNLFHLQLISRLAQKFKVGIGLEHPHNLAENMLVLFSSATNLDTTAEIQALRNKERDDPAHSDVVERICALESAALSHRFLYRSLKKNGLGLAFNDAAMMLLEKKPRMVDLTDPLNSQMREEYADIFAESGDLDALSAKGIHFRNLIMMRQMMRLADDRDVDIYIQICGGVHIAGLEKGFGLKEKYAYAESLTGLFEQAGQDVLGVPLLTRYFGQNNIAGGKQDNLFPIELQGPLFQRKEMAAEYEWLQAIVPFLMPGHPVCHIPRPE